jgi:hypothetical protein
MNVPPMANNLCFCLRWLAAIGYLTIFTGGRSRRHSLSLPPFRARSVLEEGLEEGSSLLEDDTGLIVDH